METVALIAEQVVFVLALLRFAWRHLTKKGKKSKKNQHAPATIRPQWQVKVQNATQYNADYSCGGWGYSSTKVQGEMSVRIVRDKEIHPIGTVGITNPQFDVEIARLTELAEERATSLNAISDEYA